MHRRLPNIYLMRHGETDWSVSGQHTGRADIPLTANGKTEARRLREQVQGVSFAHIFVSPLLRAMQNLPIRWLWDKAEIALDITEWDNGDYEGKTHSEINSVRPGWNLFRDGCPNGESPKQISDRVESSHCKTSKAQWVISHYSPMVISVAFSARDGSVCQWNSQNVFS